MFKLAVFFALVSCAFAAPKPGFLHAEPVIAAAPVALAHSVPVATSYQNTYKVSLKSPAVHTVSYAAAPVVHAAPVAYAAAPVVHSAPLVHSAPVVHAAPLAYAAHAW